MLENGPQVIHPKDVSTEYSIVSVGASDTGYSNAWELIDVSSFGLEYRVNCTGTPNIKIQLQQSSDNENWFIPNTFADIVASVTDKNYHGCLLAPIPIRYLRFKITEQTGTVTDTTVTLKLSAQKRFTAAIP